ncbi:MAG: hypothetical protein ACYCVD_02825 [Desulfitobacteriaceae bacterium]
MVDNTHNCKNFETDGGDTLVVGGKLDVQGGAITSNGVQAAAITVPVGGATIDVEGRAAIDAIITAIKNVGITL